MIELKRMLVGEQSKGLDSWTAAADGWVADNPRMITDKDDEVDVYTAEGLEETPFLGFYQLHAVVVAEE